MSTESVRARLAAATPGPWELYEPRPYSHNVITQAATDALGEVASYCSAPDAALIVHAPTDLALALDVIEMAKEVVELLGSLGLPPVTLLRSTVNAFEAAP